MVVDTHMAVLDIRMRQRVSKRSLDVAEQQLEQLELFVKSRCQWLYLYLTFCLSDQDRLHFRLYCVHGSEV